MGKWTKFVGVVPKLKPEASYQDKVEVVKRAVVDVCRERTGMPPTSGMLTQAYAALRRQEEELEEKLKEVNLSKTAYEQLLDEQFEAEGITSTKLTDGTSVRTQPEPYAVVKDRDAFRRWCIANGYENSLQLPWQTANAILKERLEGGEEMPTGLDAFIKTKVVLTKGEA
jgi:hypothetical protein